jgi:SPP1 gp7 family putative phage head morphogenesis protein
VAQPAPPVQQPTLSLGQALALQTAVAAAEPAIGAAVVDSPALAAWMLRRRFMVAGMAATRLAQMEKVLHQAHQAAIASGKPVDPAEVERQLNAVLASPSVPGGVAGGPAASSASNVGQTEVSAAIAGAHEHVYREAGVSQHLWLTAADEKVCPECAANEAAGPVVLGLPFPGGVAFPPQHPRCRCTTTPADAESVPGYASAAEQQPLRWWGWPDVSLDEEQRLQNKAAWEHELRGAHGEWGAVQGAVSAPAVPRTPQSAGFSGPLAAKVKLGGDAEHWGELAKSLNSIPAPLQERMNQAIGEIDLMHEIPKTGALADMQGTLAGVYLAGQHGWGDAAPRGKGNGLLQLQTEPDSSGTVLHEAMHALDEADDYPSDKLKWRFLAHKIRHAVGTKSAPEFQSNGSGHDSQRAAEELFAELASQVLAGNQSFDLDPARGGYTFHGGGALVPPDLAAEVRSYFSALGVSAP